MEKKLQPKKNNNIANADFGTKVEKYVSVLQRYNKKALKWHDYIQSAVFWWLHGGKSKLRLSDNHLCDTLYCLIYYYSQGAFLSRIY